MELRQLRYFVAVARNESFKKAAIELHIAQPALSRQIGLLEHELKTTLFTRHTRGSIPTEDGLMLLEEAERILHLTEQVKQRILFRQTHVGGKVNIGLAPTLAEWIASDLLEQVRTDFPEITLNFMEGLSPRLRKMLVTGVVDVAVLSLNVDPAHLILGASFTEPISLVGAKGDPLLDGDEPLKLAEIVDLPLIIAGIRKEGIRDIVERAFADAGLTPNNVVAEVETTLMARPMVARKLGYTISLESAAEQGIREGSLAVRPIEALRLERIVARSAEHAPSHAVLEVTQRLSTILKERFPRRS
ncbi:LysR family nitrogen assimilation transcriptional regulator [Hephaestia caeni]|uniref:LysR family nitrogen assimilation transcriptional regulator n=1 Tax=Hephaestia caeni TaxID=645617 RepID=A0A397NTX8_9SPHN|nr:LysR substrate-binding domain-containing protein [Hephaestia caeni]RIA37164.1 LysR family nitrogen assimilation transcriptional regulator [Hephaestia caeni]